MFSGAESSKPYNFYKLKFELLMKSAGELKDGGPTRLIHRTGDRSGSYL